MVVGPLDAVSLLSPILWHGTQVKATLAMAAIALYLLVGGRRYRARLHLSVLDELPAVLGKLLIATAIVATLIAPRYDSADVVSTFLMNSAVVIGLVVLGRVLVTTVIRWSRATGRTRHRTVVVGAGRVAADLCRVIGDEPRYGLDVVGFVDDGGLGPAASRVPRLGDVDGLERVVREQRISVVLVADGDISENHLVEAVRRPACVSCDLLVVPRLHHFQTRTVLPDHIGSIPVMRVLAPPVNGPVRWIKRALDVLVAAVTLVVLSPVLTLCAVAVRIEGGPGVVFRQPRVGRNGRTFDCLKFRSMRPVDDRESATQWSIAADDRVGPVGRLLRRTSLDELPQLWNILRGDMSLVGPRPERPHFVSRFSGEYDRYSYRHRVEAGLTGLAQVNRLRGDTSIADRARYDNYYIENWSLWLDFKIVVRTFAEVVAARGR
ncbi:sugar transferase [Pseudonocardia sp. ICBG1293]|uniref:sugar transferase n=1 Tax=Pseudonocardia sp. ICBG1293 TaxID=2844382 RepID=UPI001CCC0FDF|nr:sugar transferase [Pseudonocardia sp. ICBG1293]